MTSSSKKPGAAFWTTVVLVVALVGNPLSFGQACWLADRRVVPIHETATVYRPILAAAYRGPVAIRRALQWYGRLTKPHLYDPAMFHMALDAKVIRSTYRPIYLRPELVQSHLRRHLSRAVELTARAWGQIKVSGTYLTRYYHPPAASEVSAVSQFPRPHFRLQAVRRRRPRLPSKSPFRSSG